MLQEDRPGRLRRGTLMNRRDYLRMLVLASGGLLLGTAGLASGIFRRHGSGDRPARRVADSLAAGEMVTFSYPGDDDPVIGLRLNDGELVAFSSVCTHLSCAVLWRREEAVLECPCHKGIFNERTGEVVAGPPPRPLPKVRLEERSDGVWAVGTEHWEPEPAPSGRLGFRPPGTSALVIAGAQEPTGADHNRNRSGRYRRL